MGGRRTSLSVVLTAPRMREKFLAALEKRLSGDRGWWHIPGAIHISLVPESGWPHPILGTGEWVAPSNAQSATSELVRRSRGRSLPSTQTG